MATAAPRQITTDRVLSSLAEPGRVYSDSMRTGLYLFVTGKGTRRWLFVYTRNGKRREMGLGVVDGPKAVSLKKARDQARAFQASLASGEDPWTDKKKDKAAAKVPTFGEFADAFISEQAEGFRNAKHVAQWKMTMKVYAKRLRSMQVDKIDTADVLAVLKPIWIDKPETAKRTQGRIERILDAAKAQGLRSGENPARWRGHLDMLLARRSKLSRGHHKALPYSEMSTFVAKLRTSQSMSAYALEFLILTAARTGEVIGARWDEIDLERAIWTVPAQRMKGGREHRVPLSARAIEILKRVEPLRSSPDGFVFPGGNLRSGIRKWLWL